MAKRKFDFKYCHRVSFLIPHESFFRGNISLKKNMCCGYANGSS
jgi:hypothetical protein